MTTGSIQELRRELAAYDGRSLTILSELAARHRDQSCFLPSLVKLASDDDTIISEGATWIIKAELEEGRTLSCKDTKTLLLGLDGITAWQAQLHVCQCMRFIPVPDDLAPRLEAWFSALTDAERPFLRAWAVDALCRLNGASDKTDALLNRMEADDAASVRARVRNLKREFDTG